LSNLFHLNSSNDDRSMLQEDNLSVRANENTEGELKQILNPDFIKHIGLTKNGEVINPSPSRGTPDRKSRCVNRHEHSQQKRKSMRTSHATERQSPSLVGVSGEIQ